MDIYCVKCKKKTKSTNIKYELSKNNKHMIKGNCSVCKNKKSQFISAENAKKGGFIFSVPALLAGIGAASSLAGGAAGIANAVNKKKAADKALAEQKRHNEVMEKNALKKKGKGLHLKPYKK